MLVTSSDSTEYVIEVWTVQEGEGEYKKGLSAIRQHMTLAWESSHLTTNRSLLTSLLLTKNSLRQYIAYQARRKTQIFQAVLLSKQQRTLSLTVEKLAVCVALFLPPVGRQLCMSYNICFIINVHCIVRLLICDTVQPDR